MARHVIQLTKNAQTVLEKRYFWRGKNGEIIEDAKALFRRVASSIAQIEKPAKRDFFTQSFYEIMADLRFIPNTPTLMNAGRKKGQLSACFVLPVEDDLEKIFQSLKNAALIHQSGGGTGFSFSRLRPKGSTVSSTLGSASGPVSFMRIFDAATDAIKQGGARRGANMGVLRVDHPDIREFIDCKRDLSSMSNFNISVGMTDQFFQQLDQGEQSAQSIWEQILQSAWSCGDPGLVFLDRINRFNPTPKEGAMESTNPCGEQPLLPYESCNLGSLNLSKYFHPSREFEWSKFKKDIGLATRFLDNVIEVNAYPVRECGKITKKNRKIGLGVMGFADLLLMLGVPYGSKEARAWGERIMSVLDREAKTASSLLARERGAFPGWKGSFWQRLGYQPLRNATVSTVAPTGTISMIAGCSSGIEPIFSGIFYRNVLSGERLLDIHPAVEKLLIERGVKLSDLTEEKISKSLGSAWQPAHSLSIEDHIQMQAVFQRHSDSAVSKTINLPESATTADVGRAYRMAYDLGCKGITVYRDQSRPTQVLEKPQPLDEDREVCIVCS